jgi:hypothetical protein
VGTLRVRDLFVGEVGGVTLSLYCEASITSCFAFGIKTMTTVTSAFLNACTGV